MRILLLLLCSAMFMSLVVSNENFCSQGPRIKAKGLNDEERDRILHFHNFHRNEIASGFVSLANGALPGASNMKLLKWSNELAAAAQNETNQCIEPHIAPFGDIHFMLWISSKSSIPFTWATILDPWWKTILNVTIESSNFLKPSEFTTENLSFREIATAEFEYIGCGMTYFRLTNGSIPYYEVFLCKYRSENLLQQANSSYQIGLPCKKCTCDTTYALLCVSNSTTPGIQV